MSATLSRRPQLLASLICNRDVTNGKLVRAFQIAWIAHSHIHNRVSLGVMFGETMSAFKEARKIIGSNPGSRDAQIFSYLIVALEMGHEFLLSELYKLDYVTFKLALRVIDEWRNDRFFRSKVKLYDFAWQVKEQAEIAKA
jgi:hypothetical protein